MIPDIQQTDIDAAVDILKSGMLIQGPKVEELERNVANYIGVKNAIAVSNGTAGLHLALLALDIKKDDEVIIPAFSFMATGNVIELVGAKPVFVDINIETYNININLIENAITPKTKAIMPVHEFGLACDISKIHLLARSHGLKVIEDAACSLGASENDRFIGSYGEMGVFSFHPRKMITSGEGGMITTNNDKLAKNLRTLRNHGIDRVDGKSEFVNIGYNYRITDFQAALVNSQFLRLTKILEKRRKLSFIYMDELEKINKIKLPIIPKNKNHTWQSFHILLNDDCDRDAIIETLKKKNIETNLGAQCIPFQEYYQKKYRLQCYEKFPNSMKAYMKGLVLPLYNSLNMQDISYICKIFKNVI